MIERSSAESNHLITSQILNKLTSCYNDMENIAHALVYSPTIQNYINTTRPLDRILTYDDAIRMLVNSLSLKVDTIGIEIAEIDGNVILGTGRRPTRSFFDEMPLKTEYSCLLPNTLFHSNEPQGEIYTIRMPIYNLDKQNRLIGVCSYYMLASEISDILENTAMTESSSMLILDSDGNIVAYDGPYPEASAMPGAENPSYQTDILTHSETGWSVVSIISRSELFSEMNNLQKYNYIMYIILIAILSGFLIIFSKEILRPVSTLVSFMEGYPNAGEKTRINIIPNNEIGLIGKHLNDMLDKIDKLGDTVHESQRRYYEMEIAKKQMEITSYRNQLNPHFLYNTFDCIRAMALYHHADDIANITESLSRMFRYVVHVGDTTTINNELEHLNEYARIIEYRFMGRIAIVTRCDQAAYEIIVLRMILQPLVENAVFHGLERSMSKGEIIVDIRMDGDILAISISDNGYGMAPERLHEVRASLINHNSLGYRDSHDHGVALISLYHRLNLHYGEHLAFNIESQLYKGTKVAISIPLSGEGGAFDV